MPSKRKDLIYPFSKTRVYFNAIAGSAALLLSASLLLSYSDVLFLVSYLLISTVTTSVFLKIKLLLLFRMQGTELEVGELPEERSDQTWKFVLIIIALAIFLLLPVVSTQFLDPVWWFAGFSGFVTGSSLSEVVLYLSVGHS